MPRIGLHQDWDQDTIADLMLKGDAAWRIFGHDGPFVSAMQAQAHLGAWLEAPSNIERLLEAPLGSIRRSAQCRVGDIRIDGVLHGMLDALGVDARAFAVAMAFDADSHVIIGDVDFSVCRVEPVPLTDMLITGSVELNARAEDLNYEIRRIEIAGSLPDTVLEACVGRPLRDLVSHPLLDHMDLVVESAELRGTGTRIWYEAVPEVRIRDIRRD